MEEPELHNKPNSDKIDLLLEANEGQGLKAASPQCLVDELDLLGFESICQKQINDNYHKNIIITETKS